MSSEKPATDLKGKIHQLESRLESERKRNDDKTAIMKKTIAETEDLARHLQNTTLALIQERQIANARAEKEKLLNKWIAKINSSFDLESLLDLTAVEFGKFFKTSRCGILLFSKHGLMAAKEFTDPNLGPRDLNSDEFDHFDIADFDSNLLRKNVFVNRILKTKQKVIENTVTKNQQDLFCDGCRSFLALPVTIKKELVGNVSDAGAAVNLFNDIKGILYLQQCDKTREWHDREIDLLQSVLVPLSTAIEKTLLYKDARKRTEYAELLNNLTVQIRSSLNLSEILARTVNEMGRALKASRCFLYFDGYISDEYCEEGVHSIAKSSQRLILDRFKQDDDLKVISIDNLYDDEFLNSLTQEEIKEIELSEAMSALACPLHFQGILQGWIVFHSFKRRAWSRDEIAFIEAAGSQVIVAMTQSRMYEKLNSYQEKLSRELKQAARVQTSLIGGDVFDVNLETSVFYKAHSNVSGDFYWVAELAPEIVGVLIGDVSGKGPAAALLTGYLLGEFNSAVSNSALAWFPERMISFLCQSILYQNASSDFYATAWYGVFDLNTGSLKYTNAGHLNPYMIQGDKVYELDGDKDSGVPLGLINPKEIDEVYVAHEIDFKRGDKMVLFTDGVLDQKMPDGNFVPKNWVKDTLIKVKDMNVKDITYELNEKLNELSQSTPLTDDRLMISLEQVHYDIVKFPAEDAKESASLIDKIISECIDEGMPRDKHLNLRLGVTEALTNAVRYGLSKNPKASIELGYNVDKGSFKMSIRDPGPGFNWQVYNYTHIDDVIFESEGGRGIPLLLEIFDKVTWNYLGNHIGLFYYW